ncbi:GNAT family N-acetyltransferase [Stutzerimonas zhaodongensis]|uniref:GNAT family N-acetyltransferase n=1 Tax=Stutzerimonas zhaodongensis TaxID=1176257 RepID=UPI002102249F|nr:GNAT family N-acetyltransferase [Stutzerimonas zhaodongensis]MCQ2030749.1 GNAT family N-acetyltransferase [Stutzerimonas zhaodongensis]
MSIFIREARSEDADAISSLIIAAIKETNAKDYPASFIKKLPDNFSAENVAGRMLSRKVYVAVKSGDIIGTASLDKATVRSVFVMPNHQGVGIGLALMKHIEALAMQSYVKTLTVPSSITAEGFYQKLGYVKVREEYEGEEKIILTSKSL